MRNRFRAAAALLVLALPLLAGAGVVRQTVHGRMRAASRHARERGAFRMLVGRRDGGARLERLQAGVTYLRRSTEYHVVLTRSDGSGEADFGTLRTGRWGFGAFRFDTRSASLPQGVTTLTDYGGGTIEVRDGAGAVLTGSIPDFVEIGSGGGTGAAAFGHDRQPLRAADESFAGKGVILARRQDLPSGGYEELRVTCKRMTAGATYTVVAIDGSSNEAEIGTFTTSDPLGLGGLRLATAQGDTIAGGGVLALAGQDVEVRDADGVAVLTGTFPTVD